MKVLSDLTNNLTKAALMLLITLLSTTLKAQLTQDEDGYYLLSNAADWEAFATLVNNNDDYNATYNARMTADINLGDSQTVVGMPMSGGIINHEYYGTFDGQGHTLTVAYCGNVCVRDDYTVKNIFGPFCVVGTCTIKNLRVEGSISEVYGGTGNVMNVGGMVGRIRNRCIIENCSTNLNITASNTYNYYVGGLVACCPKVSNVSGKVIIKDCLCEGSITGINNNTYKTFEGAFIGYINSTSTLNIIDHSLSTIEVNNCSPKSCGAYFHGTVAATCTLTNVFSRPVSDPEKQQCSTFTDEELASGAIAFELQDAREDLAWGQRIGTDSAPVLTNEESYRVYKMIIGNGYTNDPANGYPGLRQDAEGYYLLNCKLAWADFAELVETTPTANARMTADIDLGDEQARLGDADHSDSPTYYYQGTFDGQGHTLTVHYTNVAQNAPFAVISAATIKNLHVDGTIENSTGSQPAVIARTVYGTSTVEKIWSSVTTTDTHSSWDEAAAIVGCVDGYKSGSLVMSDCLFTGTITSTGSYNGCFYGYVNSGGSASISNCLSLGTFNYSDGGSASGYGGTLNNCYIRQFPRTIPDEMQCTDDQLADGTITAALQNGRAETIWVQDPLTGQPMLKQFANLAVFNTAGSWNEGSNWSINAVPATASDVTLAAAATIPNGTAVNAGTVTIEEGGSLTIEDSGQLECNNNPVVTMKKGISAWTSVNPANNWHFIASPIATDLDPNDVENLLTEKDADDNTFDLYRYNEGNSTGLAWENYLNHTSDFSLSNGQGYLYANMNQQTLEFTGAIKVYDDGYEIPANGTWNLVGNPYTFGAYVNRPYYKMNDYGTGIEPVNNNAIIPPCTGIIINTTEVSGPVVFTKEDQAVSSANNSNIQIALSQTINSRSVKTIDKAIVTFNEGSKLGKLYFGNPDANICIPVGHEEYAIAYASDETELPLNFNAHKNGEYILTVSASPTFNYFHLIDNLTGVDVNLLQTPNYTFNAQDDDYESRFRLVFSANSDIDTNLGDDFAFISDGQLIVTGDGTLQIVDMVGRVLVTKQLQTTNSQIPTTNFQSGVYVLRLINGAAVKTQKILVKPY